MTLALAVAAGVAIGLVLGALGGGGSILAVPAFLYLFDEPAYEATTASLVVVAATATVALVPHAREGHVRFATGVTFGVLGIAGSYAGSLAADAVDPDLLLVGFSALLLLAAVGMYLRGRSTWTPPVRDDGGGSCGRDAGCWLKMLAAATVVGLLTGFFGVGGGFVILPVLTLALGFGMRAAVGTSLLVIAITSAAAFVTRAAAGVDLSWTVLLVFTAAAIVGSFGGAAVSSRLKPAQLTAGFASLLVLVSLYVAARSVPDLLA